MRHTSPDPTHPNISRTFVYPDAPVERLVTWLLAVPIAHRDLRAIEFRVADFKRELADLRATGQATEEGVAPKVVLTLHPVPVADLGETPGQRQARKMREAKERKAAERKALAGTP